MTLYGCSWDTPPVPVSMSDYDMDKVLLKAREKAASLNREVYVWKRIATVKPLANTCVEWEEHSK